MLSLIEFVAYAMDESFHPDECSRCGWPALSAGAWRDQCSGRRVPDALVGKLRSHASNIPLSFLFGLLAIVAFTLILFDRSDLVYLWMGAFFLLIAVDFALTMIGGLTEAMSMSVHNLMRDALTHLLLSAAWVMVWRVWFGEKRPSWLPLFTAVLTILLIFSTVLEEEVFVGLVPLLVALHFATVSLVLRLLLLVALFWVVVEGIRRQGLEGWLVLPVAVLHGVAAFAIQLHLLNSRISWFPFGVQVSLLTIADLLTAAVIALLLLRRLLQSVRRQRLMAIDVKQAQEVPQVIQPEMRLILAGLEIETENRVELYQGQAGLTGSRTGEAQGQARGASQTASAASSAGHVVAHRRQRSPLV